MAFRAGGSGWAEWVFANQFFYEIKGEVAICTATFVVNTHPNYSSFRRPWHYRWLGRKQG